MYIQVVINRSAHKLTSGFQIDSSGFLSRRRCNSWAHPGFSRNSDSDCGLTVYVRFAQ